MEKLVEKKLARNIGLSNFNSQQILDIIKGGNVSSRMLNKYITQSNPESSQIKPATVQVECHPYLNQAKLLKFCRANGVILSGYSPLGSPDRPWAKPDEPVLLENPIIVALAKKYGKSPAQIMIKFQLQRGVVVIAKSVTPHRIEQNLNVGDFDISAEDMDALSALDCNGRVIVPMMNGRYRDKDHPHFPFNIEF